MTLGEVAVLLAVPPQSRVPLELHFAWGLYASGAVSLVGLGFALVLGGAMPKPRPAPAVSNESSAGKTLH
jgi:hypothetical protein